MYGNFKECMMLNRNILEGKYATCHSAQLYWELFFRVHEGLTDYIVEGIHSVVIAAVVDLEYMLLLRRKFIASCLSL